MDDKDIRTIVEALEFWQQFNQEAIASKDGKSILGHYEINALKDRLISGEHKARLLLTIEDGKPDYIYNGDVDVKMVNVDEVKDDLEWYLENNPRLPFQFGDLAKAMKLPIDLVAPIEGECDLIHEGQSTLLRLS